ncbi:unnamed protein product [Miscanthus lutarioriparius]|uniref:Uncharacterized protein n=1 Tax=Miscanthus lutarioriparius TaxID=422564 RepID=A0A811Q2Z3_9POAL|nr:unnamed protein product [Miscanthus lutarioriparius]
MARSFMLCLAAACCCCLALLPPPVQGRRPGLQAAGGLGGRRLHLLPVPVPEPHFDAMERFATYSFADACCCATDYRPAKEQQRAVPVKARPAWSPAAWSVRPELRAVPGGPDPLHHHGGSPSRRPEQDRAPSP